MLLLLVFRCMTEKCPLKKKKKKSPDIDLIFTRYSPFNVLQMEEMLLLIYNKLGTAEVYIKVNTFAEIQ